MSLERLQDHWSPGFWLFRLVVAYFCMKVVQKAPAGAISDHMSIAVSLLPEWMVT